MDNKESIKSEKEFTYRGSIIISLLWLVGSMLGYFSLVFSSETGTLLEAVYIMSAVGAVMTLNNRKYGTNHTIRFYKDYIILPKILNIWRQREEIIFYNDIEEVNFVDYANIKDKNYCEIEIKTNELTYPIMGKKLDKMSFYEVFNTLRNKSYLPQIKVPLLRQQDEYFTKLKPWQKRLSVFALFISILCVLSIFLSSNFQNVFNGGNLFLTSFIISFLVVLLISFKIGEAETIKEKYQKYFLLLYIGVYGGITGGFSLIYLNGYMDKSDSTLVNMQVVSKEKNESCIKFAPIGRLPASLKTNTKFVLCQEGLVLAKVGDIFVFETKKGALNMTWVDKLKKIDGEKK